MMVAFALIVYCVAAVLLALEAGAQIRRINVRRKM